MLKPAPRRAKYKMPAAVVSIGPPLAIIPILALFYVLVLLPLTPDDGQGRVFNNLFWPLAAAITVGLAFKNRSRIDSGFFRSLPILGLIAYFLFAAASVTWAHSPDYALSRLVAHVLAFSLIVVPYALPIKTTHIIPIVHIGYVVALAISAYYVVTIPPTPVGHAGYFTHKQGLGLLCAVGIILSSHELLFGSWPRRLLAVAALSLAAWLILEAQSKSALAFTFFSLGFSTIILVLCKVLRTTPAYIIGAIVFVSLFINNPIERLGYRLYGDPTLTGRTGIWAFIEQQISRKPWFGWGFHSYYFVPNSPHNEAQGYIKDMLSTHSGFLELRLDTGWIGYWLFLISVYALLHNLKHVLQKDPARGWCYLSIVFFALLINLVDTVWFDLSHLWLLYLIVAAETVRYSRSAQLTQSEPAGLRASFGRLTFGRLKLFPLRAARRRRYKGGSHRVVSRF